MAHPCYCRSALLVASVVTVLLPSNSVGYEWRPFVQASLGGSVSHYDATINIVCDDSIYSTFNGETGIAVDLTAGCELNDRLEAYVGFSGFLSWYPFIEVKEGRRRSDAYRFAFGLGARPAKRLLLTLGPVIGALDLKYGLSHDTTLTASENFIGIAATGSYEFPLNEKTSLFPTCGFVYQEYDRFSSTYFSIAIALRWHLGR